MAAEGRKTTIGLMCCSGGRLSRDYRKTPWKLPARFRFTALEALEASSPFSLHESDG